MNTQRMALTVQLLSLSVPSEVPANSIRQEEDPGPRPVDPAEQQITLIFHINCHTSTRGGIVIPREVEYRSECVVINKHTCQAVKASNPTAGRRILPTTNQMIVWMGHGDNTLHHESFAGASIPCAVTGCIVIDAFKDRNVCSPATTSKNG